MVDAHWQRIKHPTNIAVYPVGLSSYPSDVLNYKYNRRHKYCKCVFDLYKTENPGPVAGRL